MDVTANISGPTSVTAALFRSAVTSAVLMLCKRLHEGLQALGDVILSQRKRAVGFLTLLGSLVLLTAHRTQHGSVQVLELLLRVEQAQPFKTDDKNSTNAVTGSGV